MSKFLFIDTLRLRQDGQDSPDDIFKCIFLNKNVWISVKISLKCVHKGPINNIQALVQIMAWCQPVNKPLSEPMMVSLMMLIYGSLGLNELTELTHLPQWSVVVISKVLFSNSCYWTIITWAVSQEISRGATPHSTGGIQEMSLQKECECYTRNTTATSPKAKGQWDNQQFFSQSHDYLCMKIPWPELIFIKSDTVAFQKFQTLDIQFECLHFPACCSP